LSLSLTLSTTKYAKPEAINRFFGQLTEGISNLPGVQSAAIAYDHPLQTNWVDRFELEGRVASSETQSLSANFNPVSSEYFTTVGMQMLSGRGFSELDDQDHPGVAVVNETFVRKYFPNENPIGRRMKPSPPGR